MAFVYVPSTYRGRGIRGVGYRGGLIAPEAAVVKKALADLTPSAPPIPPGLAYPTAPPPPLGGYPEHRVPAPYLIRMPDPLVRKIATAEATGEPASLNISEAQTLTNNPQAAPGVPVVDPTPLSDEQFAIEFEKRFPTGMPAVMKQMIEMNRRLDDKNRGPGFYKQYFQRAKEEVKPGWWARFKGALPSMSSALPGYALSLALAGINPLVALGTFGYTAANQIWNQRRYENLENKLKEAADYGETLADNAKFMDVPSYIPDPESLPAPAKKPWWKFWGHGLTDEDPTEYFRFSNGLIQNRFPALARPRGGSFKSFMRKTWGGIKKGHNFIRKHKLVSTITGLIPHPVAQKISAGARILGYGRRRRGHLRRGSPEARAYMARLRAMRGRRIRGGDLVSSGAWYGYRENPTYHKLC
jgi:hypothetical protein